MTRCLAVLLTFSFASAVSPAQQALIPADQRRPAPPFALKTINGSQVRLTSFAGQVLILDFWATWCGGCKEEIPWFVDFYNRDHARGLTVLGVSMDEGGTPIVRSFLASHAIPYPIALGTDQVAALYALQGMPLTILIDRKGRLAGSHAGVVDRDHFASLINKLLQESAR